MERYPDRKNYLKLRKLVVSGVLAAAALSGCVGEETAATTTQPATKLCDLLNTGCDFSEGQTSITQPKISLDLEGKDIDLDGKENFWDDDIDGDGLLNPYDGDFDGDGVPNEADGTPWGKLGEILSDPTHDWYVLNTEFHSDNDNIPNQFDPRPDQSMFFDGNGNNIIDIFENWPHGSSNLDTDNFNDVWYAHKAVTDAYADIEAFLRNIPNPILEDLNNDYDNDGILNKDDRFPNGYDYSDYDNDGIENYRDVSAWGD